MKTSVLFSTLASGFLVSGHGYVQQIWLGDNLVDAWDPYKDPQKDPPVDKITRKFEDNGPVTDGLFTVRDFCCVHGWTVAKSPNRLMQSLAILA